jgi:hypothetical protein
VVQAARTIRIACTNDFLCSLSPMRTSYGSLPGGEGLRRAVDRQREAQPTLWADAGDFSQGGPLSVTSAGVLNFRAASELGIDVGTVGNHEFDWGMAHLAEHAPALRYPLICANADVGLPPTALIGTEAGAVGFVGLTHPDVDMFSPHPPRPDPDLAAIVPEHARRLRSDGAVAVVVLLHFGVNWTVSAAGEHEPDPTPLAELCAPFLGAVDAVVAGHTLGRWAGEVEGTPFVQPWAFGAELGIIELAPGDARHRAWLEPVAPRGRWTGAGATDLDVTERQVIGEIAQTLLIRRHGDRSLADYAARALRVAIGCEGAVVPVVGMHQPAIEGVLYEWPAGPVTEADLARLWPWTDDGTLVGEVGRAELETIVGFEAPEPWLAWGTDAGDTSASDRALLAVPKDYVDWGAVQVDQLVGRRVAWRETAHRLRDAVRAALREGARPPAGRGP